MTQRLVRCTCKRFHKLILVPPSLDLTSDLFLQSLAQAHISIIREAEAYLCNGNDDEFPRFLYFVGADRTEPVSSLFPYFARLNVFDRGRYFAGYLRRVPFDEAQQTELYTNLEYCFNPLPPHRPGPEDFEENGLDFLRCTLENIVYIEDMYSFLLHTGALILEVHHLPNVPGKRHQIRHELIVTPLALQPVVDVIGVHEDAKETVALLPQSAWRDTLLQMLEDREDKEQDE